MASSPGDETPRALTGGQLLGLDAALALLAIVGTWLLTLGAVGVVPLALALIGVGVRWWLRARETSWRPLTDSLVVRALVTAGAAVALTRLGPPDLPQTLLAAAAMAVLVGGLAVEPLLARAARFTVPIVANLPGVATARAARDDVRPAAYASWLAIAVGLVVAALGGPALIWLVVAVAALVPYAQLGFDGRAKILATRRLRTEVPTAVAAYAPEFVLYTSRPDDASYQVMMWLPHLKRTGRPFLVVTRNGEPAAALAGLTDVPIVEARRTADLEALLVPSLKAALYPNASSGNGTFVRYQHLTHIYIGHGDSDKPPSYNPTHAMYDRIFAAGPAATRRYAAHGVYLPLDKFQIVGRPQVEDVRPAAGPIAEVSEPVVLYAPTWRGHVEETLLYSLPEGERIVRSLLDHGATVIFRPHPFSLDFPEDAAAVRRIRQLLADNARETGRQHLYGPAAETERSIFDVINASDAMVSDVSSVVSDFLFSGKPFAMVAVPSEPSRFVEEYPLARASYVIRGDLADLDDAITQMLGADPLLPERIAVRADYLGDFPTENYSDAFVSAVRDIAAKAANDFEREDEPDERSDERAGESRGHGGSSGPDEPAEAEDFAPRGEAGDHTAPERDPDATGLAAADGITQPGFARWRNYRRAFASEFLKLFSTILAAGAVAAAALGAPPVVLVVVFWAAIWAAIQSTTRMLRNPRSRPRILTQAQLTRAVLVIAAAAFALRSGAGAGVWIGLALIAMVLAVELHIRAAWGALGLEAVGLPLVKAQMPELVPRVVVPLAGFGALAVGVVLLQLPYADVTVLLVGLVVFGLGLDASIRALIRARRVVAAEDSLRPALEAYAPQFAVYFASNAGAEYQVGMWLPYFLRIGRRFMVVTRTVPMLREITELTRRAGVEVPVIYRPTLRSVEETLVPSLTAAFYVNNAVRNTHYIERRELTHVWLNHGDSEKPACYNPVHAIYDKIFAAGQAGIDRYARHGVEIPAEKFQIVGRPQVESIEVARGPIESIEQPTVLYAPTWQGPFADSRVYSLPVGADIVRGLLARGVTVIFRPHPFNRRYAECVRLITGIEQLLRADREATGRPHRFGQVAEHQMSIEDCFNASDAMISDVSAVVSDYLRSDKPFSIVSVGRSPEQLLLEAPAARAAYVLREDLSNAEQVYSELLDTDSLADVRARTRAYYLGDFDHGDYAEVFLAAARAVIDRTAGVGPAGEQEHPQMVPSDRSVG